MPTYASAVVPPPKNWEEFQDITLSALRVRWRTTDLQHTGRQGQPQAGVDIHGRDDRGRRAGVQCKETEGVLRLPDVVKEIRKAEGFVPPLEVFFVATTVAHDAKLQQAMRVLSEQRVSDGRFAVEVLFWGDISNDLIGDVAEFGKYYPQWLPPTQTPAPPAAPISAVEAAFGPDFEPQLHVLQRGTRPGFPEEGADEWFRVRVYADAFQHAPFEPDEEKAFLELVKRIYPEHGGAKRERASGDGVRVEDRGEDLRFHRRWLWWTRGAVGMAGTLKDLHRPGFYSVADVTLDVLRCFHLIAELGLRGYGRAAVDIDPFRLSPAWDLSDLRARGRPEGRLAGVEEEGVASSAHSRKVSFEIKNCDLGALHNQAPEIAAKIIVHAARVAHGASVRSADLTASIPQLLEFYRRIQRL